MATTLKALEANTKELIQVRERLASLATEMDTLKEQEAELRSKVLKAVEERGRPFSFDKYLFSSVPGQVLKIVDENGLIEYCKTAHPDLVELKVKRSDVLKAMKSGEEFPGAEVEEKSHLRLSVNN